MNFKRSTTSMAIALMALSLVSMTSIQQDSFAQTVGMSITATANEGSDTITITGKTTSDLTDIALRIMSPSGNVVDVAQIAPDDNGEFQAKFKIGPTWTEDGLYEIQAKQSVVDGNSLYTLEVLVEIVNGMAMETAVMESNLDSTTFTPPSNAVAELGLVLDNVVAENGDTVFEVTGMTDRTSQDITVTVTAPNGNVVTVTQVSPTVDGKFATEIAVGGPLWKQDGFYTVDVQQFKDPNYTASTQIEIEEGVIVPEFGTIAIMILAIAIISIIAISARSRLSIMPRY